jgi:hypothetical protein
MLTQGSRALAGGFGGANDPISDRIFFHKLLTAPDVLFCAKQFDFPADTIIETVASSVQVCVDVIMHGRQTQGCLALRLHFNDF